MFCMTCGTSLPSDAKFCSACGAAQIPHSSSSRRSNGFGSIYKRGKGYEVQFIIGYKDGSPIKKRKSGFKTKREAQDYCILMRDPVTFRSVMLQPRVPIPTYEPEPPKRKRTLDDLYREWEPSHSQRVSENTLRTYIAAYKHFQPLYKRDLEKITAKDLQDCLDKVTPGSPTRANMAIVARLLWAYAISATYVVHDITRTLYVGERNSKQREPITEDELERIRQAIETVPYAEYIYVLCYLGFRPGEMLALKKTDLHEEAGIMYLIGGSKTAAGKNRRVPVPNKIRDIIINLRDTCPTDWLFPMAKHGTNGKLMKWQKMSDQYLRESVFSHCV